MTPDSNSLEVVIAIPFILGENDPPPIGNLRQPRFIVLTPLEMRLMALKTDTVERQNVQYWLAVLQILIQKKDEIIKLQLLLFPSG